MKPYWACAARSLSDLPALGETIFMNLNLNLNLSSALNPMGLARRAACPTRPHPARQST